MQYDKNRATEIENFFSKEYQIDTPKKLNRGVHSIPDEIIKQIETKGITSEQIENWAAPVFKYNTQITVHGFFNLESNGRLNGYKNLILNQNESLGIKYNAVDAEKKQRIYSALRMFGFHTCKDSQSWYAYKLSENLKDRETCLAKVAEYKELLSKIPADMYVGNSNIQVFKHQWFGTVHALATIHINAIREVNVWAIIETLTGKTKEQVLQAEQDKADKEAQEYEQLKADNAKRDAERAVKIKATEQLLRDAGYSEQRITADKTGNFYNVDYNGNLDIYHVYSIKGKQKNRYEYHSVKNLDEVPEFREYGRDIFHGRKLWAKIQQPTPDKPQPEVQTGSVKTIQYSEKCIAVYGDTRPIKDTLKSIGARFNPFLTIDGIKQAGWVLPSAQRDKLNFINK